MSPQDTTPPEASPAPCALCGAEPSEFHKPGRAWGVPHDPLLNHQCVGAPLGLICNSDEWATHNAFISTAISARTASAVSEATAGYVEILEEVYQHHAIDLSPSLLTRIVASTVCLDPVTYPTAEENENHE